jgi:tRNA(Ile)-lysidine synthase
MHSHLHQRVRRTIRRHALLPEGSRVVVGVSGGSDSVALVRLLNELAEHGGFTVAAVAHLNHKLRPTADQDAEFTRALADRLSLPFYTEAADVAAFAAHARLSIEDAARRIRYAFLERTAVTVEAGQIAVGHTEDDQAETFLMKLIRGASLTGLGGIYPRRGRIIRPLLDVSRADLRAYLLSLSETWIDDESNADVDNPRNRIRHRVLPELDTALAGASRPNIARAAALAREDGEWLDSLAEERFAALGVRRVGDLEFDAEAIAALPRPTARRVLVRALRTIAGSREISQEHVDSAMAVVEGISGGIDVPGGRVELLDGKLVLLQQKVVSK